MRTLLAVSAGLALLIAGALWYEDRTYVARMLGLGSLPPSVEVLHESGASWTDFHHEWIVSLEPDDARALLAGRAFALRPLAEPAALYESETGTHSIQPVSGAAERGAGAPLFEIGSRYVASDDETGAFLGVAFSSRGDRAFIRISGD